MITSTWQRRTERYFEIIRYSTDPLAAVRQEIDRLGYVQVGLEMRDDGGIKLSHNGWTASFYAYDLWDILRNLPDDEIPPAILTVAQPARMPW